MNVKTLSRTTHAMLNAFALSDTPPTPEELVEELDPASTLDEATYLEVVRIELMDKTSLPQELPELKMIVICSDA